MQIKRNPMLKWGTLILALTVIVVYCLAVPRNQQPEETKTIIELPAQPRCLDYGHYSIM